MVQLDESLISSTSCGPFGIEFHSEEGEEFDAILFDSTQSGSTQSFTALYQDQEEMLGQYEIRYKVFLKEYPDRFVEQSQPFVLSIVDPCIQETIDFPRPSRCPIEAIDLEDLSEELPEWMLLLDHQEINLFESRTIKLGEPENTFGQLTQVEVDLGGAATFVTYDLNGNKLLVQGEKMTVKDVGTWQIFIIANDTSFSEEPTIHEKSFYLRIVDFERTKKKEPIPLVPDEIEDKPKVEVIKASEFKGIVRENFESEVESDDQPRPFVIDFTAKGLLTIGWSMEMVPPRNITKLMETKIAVKTEEVAKERMLKDVVFVDEDGNVYEEAQLLDAIEVELVSEEEPDETIQIAADVIDFNKDFFKLQIDYTDRRLKEAEHHFN